jgi:hypothetical protein
MKASVKVLLAICLLMFTSSVFAADTLKIHLTYKHNLDKDGHSLGYLTVCQKFYTPEQQLFREVNYNEQSGQIDNYTFYFYKDGKLFTQECYNQKDSLLYILKYNYDGKGRENEVVRFERQGNGIKESGKTVYTYNKTGKLHQQKIYFGQKAGSTTSYVYSKDGNLKSENLKCDPVSKLNVKTQTRSYFYGAGKNPEKVEITGQDLTGKSFQRSEAYIYDNKGNLSSVSITGNDMPDGLIKTFKYLGSGYISSYMESNAAGLCHLMLEYDYKKHFMEKGTQVSYFAPGK